MFYKEGQTLYLSAWQYNAALTLEELAKIVKDHGGKVRTNTHGFIVNRAIMEKVESLTAEIDAAKKHLRKAHENGNKTLEETLTGFVLRKADEKRTLENKKNDPVPVEHESYISFILEGVYYYLEINDNPFFPHYYQKTPIKDGKRSQDACLDDIRRISGFGAFDSFLAAVPPSDITEDRKEAANMIFNALVKAENSLIRRDSHKTRVQNTYNNGYHYETVFDKERFETLDLSQYIG